jgi:hypothetical protein
VVDGTVVVFAVEEAVGSIVADIAEEEEVEMVIVVVGIAALIVRIVAGRDQPYYIAVVRRMVVMEGRAEEASANLVADIAAAIVASAVAPLVRETSELVLQRGDSRHQEGFVTGPHFEAAAAEVPHKSAAAVAV